MSDAADVRRFIEGRRLLVVAGHKEPDGDCVASQLAVAALAGRLGTPTLLLSAGPFDRPEIEDFAARFAASAGDADLGPGAAAIIVDCSTPDRTGAVAPLLARLPCLVIDHHSSGEVFGDERFVDPSAPSTTALVLALYESLGHRGRPRHRAPAALRARARTRDSSVTSAPTARRPSARWRA